MSTSNPSPREKAAAMVWVEPELRESFKTAAHRRGGTISTATSEAWSLWLDRVEEEDIAHSIEVARKHLAIA